jgi:hypothetical protein
MGPKIGAAKHKSGRKKFDAACLIRSRIFAGFIKKRRQKGPNFLEVYYFMLSSSFPINWFTYYSVPFWVANH